jgi:hypothetical protein
LQVGTPDHQPGAERGHHRSRFLVGRAFNHAAKQQSLTQARHVPPVTIGGDNIESVREA